jgi:hypothetical protein
MKTYTITITTEVQAESERVAELIALENNIACGKYEIDIQEKGVFENG